ncbi:basic salivary proline-rich protein 2-like [Pogoniulus pusillus]|uniref:basic salivary proline-rich protein 2-like n=1 Tax=Pogoniulus pusillus TaxID=488313 RepID=UPI0030B99304
MRCTRKPSCGWDLHTPHICLKEASGLAKDEENPGAGTVTGNAFGRTPMQPPPRGESHRHGPGGPQDPRGRVAAGSAWLRAAARSPRRGPGGGVLPAGQAQSQPRSPGCPHTGHGGGNREEGRPQRRHRRGLRTRAKAPLATTGPARAHRGNAATTLGPRPGAPSPPSHRPELLAGAAGGSSQPRPLPVPLAAPPGRSPKRPLGAPCPPPRPVPSAPGEGGTAVTPSMPARWLGPPGPRRSELQSCGRPPASSGRGQPSPVEGQAAGAGVRRRSLTCLRQPPPRRQPRSVRVRCPASGGQFVMKMAPAKCRIALQSAVETAESSTDVK